MKIMKLVLLGTNGFLPTDQAQTACFMLPEPGILLDAGSGLYRLPAYLQTPALDIYLSHAHGDHTNGLVHLLASYFKKLVLDSPAALDEHNVREFMHRANEALHRTRIHAAPETISELQQQYELYGFDWRPLQAQEPLPGSGRLTYFPLEHGQVCVGYRLDWPGHSLAYVTDTVVRMDAPYIQKISGVDLLLHEANGPDRLPALAERIHHAYPSAAARVAARAGVKRLVLIHKSPIEAIDIHPDLPAARSIFAATEIGEDGMEIDF
jgi:ribonuclease Z